MHMMGMNSDGKMCRCPHHSMVPGLVVAFGLVFLLGALDVMTERAVSLAWPIIVMLGGLMKMTSRMCTCCQMPR